MKISYIDIDIVYLRYNKDVRKYQAIVHYWWGEVGLNLVLKEESMPGITLESSASVGGDRKQ